ncbi:hypothetical protein BROUX41_004263 [Berkeleyomyces rouxiae]|uniref:uncharacterized protein n=1 Tax=Berkeleyomyces rouxiae TaxID=2035830 RepID=UPI003B7A95D4
MSTKNIFITGGTGYIGAEVTKKAIARGWTVRALSRSEASDTKLRALGATPVRGDLTSSDVLATEAGSADAFINVAYDMDLRNPNKSFDKATAIERAMLDAIVPALRPGSALILTTGVLVAAMQADGEVDETAPLGQSVFSDRGHNEEYALAKGREHGFAVSIVRPAVFVYGLQGSGVAMLMAPAAKNGAATYVDDGAAQVSAVHVRDCAEVYMLVLEKRAEGVFNVSADSSVSYKQITEAIGGILKVPVSGIPKAVMEDMMGPMMASFLSSSSRVSGRKAREQLGWKPEEKSLLDEITQGSYVELAATLKMQAQEEQAK